MRGLETISFFEGENDLSGRVAGKHLRYRAVTPFFAPSSVEHEVSNNEPS
jgi:hypothetical protein